MIAVHNAPPQLPAPPAFLHRRAPSAPSVVVQPTKTPGLLSLSRPAAPRAQQQQARAQQPRRSSGNKASPKVDATPEAAPAPAPAATPAATPERPARGRQQGPRAGKDKHRRSPSSASPHRRAGHHASPPLAPATPDARPRRHGGPARAQSFHQTGAGADPFLVPADASPKQAPAAPKLAPRPAGKIARRRQQAPDSPTPAPAKAIPVRAQQQQQTPARNMARSAPAATVPRPAPRRAATLETREAAFRVCDDTTDTEDDSSSGPVTPLREDSPTWQQTQFGGAPAALAGFIVPGACATPSPAARVHRRAPSDVSVFDMSFEDGWPAPAGNASSELKQMLFSLQRPSSAGARKQQVYEPFFANSQFQNSPSPEDLPTVDF